MPFGLSKAESVYSPKLDPALAHLPSDYWLRNLDYILVNGYLGILAKTEYLVLK